MKIYRVLAVVCAVLMIACILVTGCAKPAPAPTPTPTPTPPKQEVFNLTFGTQHPAEAPMNKVINEAWIRWLDKESGGRIKMRVIPGSQVAAPPDLYDAARTGLADMTCEWYSSMPDRFPILEVTLLPFIFGWPSSAQIGQTAQALFDKYPELQADLGDGKEVKVLNFHSTGAYHICTIKKPVKTLEDLKGQIIFEFGAYPAANMKALGGEPAAIDITESYDALAKGVADGVDTSMEGHFVWKWNEVCNYCTVVGTVAGPFVHTMNLNTWNKLPPDLQKLFVGENAWRMARLYGHQFDEDDQILKGVLDKQLKEKGFPGVYVLPDAEKARWVKAAEPVLEQWVAKASTKIGEAKARAILDDAKKFAAQYAYKGFNQEAENTLHEWGALGH